MLLEHSLDFIPLLTTTKIPKILKKVLSFEGLDTQLEHLETLLKLPSSQSFKNRGLRIEDQGSIFEDLSTYF